MQGGAIPKRARIVWAIALGVTGLAAAVTANQVITNGRWSWGWLLLALLASIVPPLVQQRLTRSAGRDVLTLNDGRGLPPRMENLSSGVLGVHPAGEVDTYFRRDFDDELDNQLSGTRQVVALVGTDRLAGVSRSMYEVAKRHLGTYRVLVFQFETFPPIEAASKLIRYWAEKESGVVVWLDGLTLPHLHWFAAMWTTFPPPGNVRFLVSTTSTEIELDLQPRKLEIALAEFGVVRVPPLTKGEVDRLRRAIEYAVLVSQLDEGERLMGRLMVSLSHVRSALTAGSTKHNDRVALLRAVADWDRARVPVPLTRRALGDLFCDYRPALDSGWRRVAWRRSFKDALDWATETTEERLGYVLIDSSGRRTTYRSSTLLIVLANNGEEPCSWTTPWSFWEYANVSLPSDAKMIVGASALHQGRTLEARLLLGPEPGGIAPEMALELGNLLAKSEEYALAIPWLEFAARSASDSEVAVAAMMGRALVAQLCNQLIEARTWLIGVVNRDADGDPDIPLARLAQVCLQLGDLTDARRWFERLVQQGSPEARAQAQLGLADLALEAGNADEARRWYGDAIVSGFLETVVSAFINLGTLEFDQNDLEAAAACFECALTLAEDADHIDVLTLNLANVANAEGRPQEASAAWGSIAKSGSVLAPRAMFNLGRLCAEQGDASEARRWWRSGVETKDEEFAPLCMLNLGHLESQASNVLEARRMFKLAIRCESTDVLPAAQLKLGALESGEGNREVARALWLAAAQSHDGDSSPRAMFNLGNLEWNQSHIDDARGWYRRSIGSGHEISFKATLNLARMEFEQGHEDVARDLLGQVQTTGTSQRDAATHVIRDFDLELEDRKRWALDQCTGY